MKLLYVVDGRSPTALNWIQYFIQAGHEVHLVSTYPCATQDGTASQFIVPLALSNFYEQSKPGGKRRLNLLRKLLPVGVRTRIRQMAVPLTFSQAVSRLQGIIQRVQPELIHAMRIPYEGILATAAVKQNYGDFPGQGKIPVLISVWGNDFTLHAHSSKGLAEQTRLVLRACDALHTDCQRDRRLAAEWGFTPEKPTMVLPGGGGVQLEVFYPPDAPQGEGDPLRIINPRGFRAYVRNDTFFQAIPMVMEKHPEVCFVCPEMANEGQAHGWVAELGIGQQVELLPTQTRQQMAELFRQAQISISITTHDGTPNTLLEAMACGSFPIAGDIESIREWITQGENGLLVDPDDPDRLAEAILQAIESPELRGRAREQNLRQVWERAEYGKCMRQAEEFYNRLTEK